MRLSRSTRTNSQPVRTIGIPIPLYASHAGLPWCGTASRRKPWCRLSWRGSLIDIAGDSPNRSHRLDSQAQPRSVGEEISVAYSESAMHAAHSPLCQSSHGPECTDRRHKKGPSYAHDGDEQAKLGPPIQQNKTTDRIFRQCTRPALRRN